MKKIRIRLVLTLALLGFTVAGCTKEDVTKDTVIASSQLVTYVVDGRQYNANPQNEEDWSLFLDRMIALAEEGHAVQFWRSNRRTEVFATKEVQTFTTTDVKEAKRWAKEKEEEGFIVNISYNPQTGEYNCIAVR